MLCCAVLCAGCRNGFGVFVRGSTQSTEQAWKRQYIDNFSCRRCPSGSVPFLPGSNLELVWDGSTWTIQLIDDGTGKRTVSAELAVLVGSTGSPAELLSGGGSVTVQAAAESVGEELGADAQVQAYSPTTAAAIQTWYQKAYTSDDQGQGYVAPPVFPGQCVQCPDGSQQDGYRCELIWDLQLRWGFLNTCSYKQAPGLPLYAVVHVAAAAAGHAVSSTGWHSPLHVCMLCWQSAYMTARANVIVPSCHISYV